MKTPMKTETFENGFKSGDDWKRIVLKTLRLISSVDRLKTETFENGDVKRVTCHRFQSKSKHAQSQVPVAFLVFERFTVDRWKRYKNASVDESILLRFRRDENGYFWKRISVNGALE